MKKTIRTILSCMACVGILVSPFLPVQAEELSKAVICNHDYNLYYEENLIGYQRNNTQHWPEYTRVGRCGHCHVVVEVLGTTVGSKSDHQFKNGNTCETCGYMQK